MTIAAPPSGLQPEDYDEIEAAVMETARGRWFLAEYARRTRAAETDRLLAALTRIDARLDSMGAPPRGEAVPIIDRLEALVWKLRESGVEDFVCSKIEALARDIAACGVAMDPPITAPAPQAPGDVETQGDPVLDGGAVAPPCEEALGSVESSAEAAGGVHAPAGDPPIVAAQAVPSPPDVDLRLEALLWLDRLPLLDRMALFA